MLNVTKLHGLQKDVTSPLFRKEALDAKCRGSLGSVSLAQPLRLWALTLGAALVAIIVGLFLTLGSYTRRSKVAGQLVPSMGLSTVTAPETGLISRLDVIEGSPVNRGQTLAVVTVPRATVTEGDTLAALERRLERRREGLIEGRSAQKDLIAAQDTGYRSQLSVARHELAQVETEIGIRQAQIRISEETLQRLRQLEDDRYVSLLEIKQQESSGLSWHGEMQALQRQAIVIRRSIEQLEQASRELLGQRRATDAALTRDLALLEQEKLEVQARGALTVNAPVAGTVSAQMIKSGQTVQAGQPLLTLLPVNAELEAELLVPSRAIGFIEPGDRVLLRYQAYPYQKFGHHEGKVIQISRSALIPGELGALTGSTRTGEPLYRVTVSLAKQVVTAYGKDESLKPGMLLDADILGERRRLIEWILEPLYSLKGMVSDA